MGKNNFYIGKGKGKGKGKGSKKSEIHIEIETNDPKGSEAAIQLHISGLIAYSKFIAYSGSIKVEDPGEYIASCTPVCSNCEVLNNNQTIIAKGGNIKIIFKTVLK